jgi:type II secretory pathway pseudopilin PulG
MVGAIVIGLISTIIAAIMFAIVPWSQDSAAKDSLASMQTAQSVAKVMTGSYLGADELAAAGYLQTNTAQALDAALPVSLASYASASFGPVERTSIRVILGAGAGCYVAVAQSASGAIFFATPQLPGAIRYEAGATSTDWCVSMTGVVNEMESTPQHTPPYVQQAQCNGTDNVGGMAVECDVVVTNNIDLDTGATSSTVTARWCHGAANTVLPCTTSAVTSAQLATTVDQCNGSGNGGGGTAECTVAITNNITGTATRLPAAIKQCVGSGTGGGTEPTVVCNPVNDSAWPTIDQCNGSGTGGGGTMRVRCTVDSSTETTELPIVIKQCNGSANGGGAYMTCRASVVNNVFTRR